MRLQTSANRLLLRLDRGEELVSAVLSVATAEGLHSGLVLGIGALEDVELGYYVLDERRYLRRVFPGIHELLSLQANLTLLDGKPFLHAHVILGTADFATVGGHLFHGTVAVVAELAILPGAAAVERAFDPRVGLNLWKL